MKKFVIAFVGYIMGVFLTLPITFGIVYKQPWYLLIYLPAFLLLMMGVLKGEKKDED